MASAADPPASLIRFNPSMNSTKAAVESWLNKALISAPVWPVIFERISRCLPPLRTAASIICMTRPTDVPATSDLTPTDANAAAIADAWAELTPKTAVARAISVVISVIWLSVAAKLLPRATITDPSTSTVSMVSPVTLRIRANAMAASLPDKSVAVPSLATVSVNFKILAAPFTPS